MAMQKPTPTESTRPLRRDLDRLRLQLEAGQLDAEEILELCEAVENRLDYLEEENQGFQAFFENLVKVLDENLQRDEIRELIRQMGLREILLHSDGPEIDIVH